MVGFRGREGLCAALRGERGTGGEEVEVSAESASQCDHSVEFITCSSMEEHGHHTHTC